MSKGVRLSELMVKQFSWSMTSIWGARAHARPASDGWGYATETLAPKDIEVQQQLRHW